MLANHVAGSYAHSLADRVCGSEDQDRARVCGLVPHGGYSVSGGAGGDPTDPLSALGVV